MKPSPRDFKTNNANLVRSITSLLDNSEPNQLVSKRSMANYLHTDMALTTLSKNTKKVFEESNEIEEQKKMTDIRRKIDRKMVKIGEGVLAPTILDQITENVRRIDRSKSGQEMQFIINCLKQHFLFYNLSLRELENMVTKMFYCEADVNECIFKQDDEACLFFLIARGRVQVVVYDQIRRELGAGEGFGELDLLFNIQRSASVRTLEKSSFWCMDRATFKDILVEITKKEYSENRIFIDEVKFFNTMTSEQKDLIAGALITQKFTKGIDIVHEGDPASSFYIIKEGTVLVLKEGGEIRKMARGDSFGEQALYYHTVRTATVKTMNHNVRCLALGRDILTEVLGNEIQVITQRNQQIWAMERNTVLSQLTKSQLEKIAESMKVQNYKTGSIVFKAGEVVSSKFIVLHQGILKEAKKGKIVAEMNTVFGDSNILGYNLKIKYEDNIIAEEACTTSEINMENFLKSLRGKTFEEILIKNAKIKEKKGGDIPEIREKADKIRLDELLFLRKLGSGQTGIVYLVRAKDRKDDLALKCIVKQHAVELQLEKQIEQERQALEAVNFPLLVGYIRSFKDDTNIYLLQEHINGIELFDVIREIGILDTHQARFYTASLILAIEHLHSLNIVYRDLRPENIMLEEKGYIKLIDFGTAKMLKSRTQRTFTVIGAPHYMAPEIISGKGYTLSVDLWSLGVVLFELICGSLPFGEDREDPKEIYEEILTKTLKYSTYCDDKKAQKLLNQLMNRVPQVRLGNSFTELKANPWFEGFEWDQLLEQELKPPYIPPKQKVISSDDIHKMVKHSKKFLDQLKEEQKFEKKYHKDQASDPNWDKAF